MERHIGLLLLAAAGCVPEGAPKQASTASEVSSRFATLAGTDGVVTTLAFYPEGGVHPGVNAVDIGAPGGSAVWHQTDYLDADIAGGWLRADVVQEAGYCSQWSPGSPYYNGAKIVVHTYFYGAGGAYLGWHRAAYQHVVPYDANMGEWRTFNNASAEAPAWPSPDVTLNDGTSGGLHLGEVFGVSGAIWNGPGGGLCTTGSHLHQEGDGARAGQRHLGQKVTARYSDLHDFTPAAGYPAPGAPPDGEDPCKGLDYAGRCDGAVLVWCDAGAVSTYDCGAKGLSCAWQDEAIGYNCR